MNEEGELLPPVQYDLVWLLLAIALVVLAIGFYIFVILATKKQQPEPDVVMLPRSANSVERLSLIKRKYSRKVTEIQEEYHKGHISSRKAFQALSVNLRNFTHEYSGSGAHAMSLTDLHDTQAPTLLIEKIRNYYPLAFQAANQEGNVDLAVEDALKVIQLWR